LLKWSLGGSLSKFCVTPPFSISTLDVKLKTRWAITGSWEPLVIPITQDGHHGNKQQKVFKMKIWIYWSESNSWIYFYIHVVLNKNWKIYWSDQQFYWSWDEGPVLIVRNVIYYNSGDFYSLQWWSVIKTIKFCDKFLSLTYGRLVVFSRGNGFIH
jgi:hypothetical protein